MPAIIPNARRPLRRGPGPARGFTLIEILCMVVVLGIASLIILPQMTTRDDLKAAAAARALMADLLYAQNRSIAFQKMHYVRFNNNGSYDVLDSIGPDDIITHPVLQSPYTVQLATNNTTGVTAQSVSFDGQKIVAFDSLGVPYSYNASNATATTLNSGSVVLKCGVYSLTVQVMPYSGEIKIN